MSEGGTLPASYFDALYAADSDPWRFESSAYEKEKYAATLAALPAGPVDRLFEVGCSIGVLTLALAARCASLLAVDVAESALAAARKRCAKMPHVIIQKTQIPDEWPDQSFDVIVLSEVLYYLDTADIAEAARQTRQSLRPGGSIILVHYTLPTNYPQTGNAAVEAFISAGRFRPFRQTRHDSYRLDVLKIPARN